MQDVVTQAPETKNLKFRNSKLSHETSKKIADICYHLSKILKFKLYLFLGVTSFEIEKLARFFNSASHLSYHYDFVQSVHNRLTKLK